MPAYTDFLGKRKTKLALKEEQQENRRLCGRSYSKDYLAYVCVNEIGDLIKPHYVTESFPKLLNANGLRHIRYHDPAIAAHRPFWRTVCIGSKFRNGLVTATFQRRQTFTHIWITARS